MAETAQKYVPGCSIRLAGRATDVAGMSLSCQTMMSPSSQMPIEYYVDRVVGQLSLSDNLVCTEPPHFSPRDAGTAWSKLANRSQPAKFWPISRGAAVVPIAAAITVSIAWPGHSLCSGTRAFTRHETRTNRIPMSVVMNWP